MKKILLVLCLWLVSCSKPKPPVIEDVPDKEAFMTLYNDIYQSYVKGSRIGFLLNVKGEEESYVSMSYDLSDNIKLFYEAKIGEATYEVYMKDGITYIHDNGFKYKTTQSEAALLRTYNFGSYTNDFHKKVLEVFSKENVEMKSDYEITSSDGYSILINQDEMHTYIHLRYRASDATYSMKLTLMGLDYEIVFPNLDNYPNKEVSS